ncbi:MAG TPA: two-component regulator propeller domain-containing protein [Chitinophaga sp.]|uniref:two-component regulator propeller domain-containing protein n=1 Tax=Chitinophaga sp. TaxID=1869181 RepID=UPI002DBED79D|nr:two-component regulator propeller domain-containing protein [Chitinophaga sp.]HEU4551316.1 two-component regulator propeller domain-containing protein [Chitinophaga sp.]
MILLLLAGVVPDTAGQSANYHFYSITTDNGLPTNDYQKICYDSRGFIWLASFDGLFRWDGYTITKYLHDEKDSLTLDNNIVYSIFEDSRHRLWVGTIDGLHLYDPALNIFRRIALDKAHDKIPVNAILEDDDRQLWLGTSNGLCRYDPVRQQADWYPMEQEAHIIFCLAKGPDHTLWGGTFNKGVIRFNTRTHRFSYLQNTAANPNVLPSNKIQCILVDHQQRVWIGTEDRGITVMDIHGNRLAPFHNNLEHSTIRCLYEDKSGNIWIGVGREPLCLISKNDLQPVPVTTPSRNANLPLTTITSITEDDFGNTWFASSGNGLFSTNRNKNRFTNLPGNGNTPPGLKTTVITAIHQGHDGKIWIGTAGNGMLRYEPDSTGGKLLPTPLYGSLAVNDIAEDRNGDIWVGTWSSGLVRYSPLNGSIQRFTHDPANSYSLINNDVKCLLADDSLLWVGTHGEGLSVLNLRTRRFTHYRNNHNYPFNMQAPAWVNHLYKDHANRVWISTYSGIFLWDGKTFRQFSHSNDPASINSNSVNMVCGDSKGNIWVVTEQGLDQYQEKTGAFLHLNAKYGLPPSMKSIVCDRTDQLWMGTNEGLICLQPATGKVTRYDNNDGLPEKTFFQKAAMVAANGWLYFGSPKGFSCFNPASITPLEFPSTFYFRSLYIFGTEQRPGQPNSVLQRSLYLTDTITLTQKQSFFTIEFAAINLYAPQKIRYSYKLDNQFSDWINVVDERKISFAHLPPGIYNLQVRHTDVYGSWQPNAKTLVIRILPYWWQTWWFKVLAALVIAFIITGTFYWRVASVRKRNRFLRAEVKRQTARLQESNISLLEQRDKISLQKEKLEASYAEIVRQTNKILEQQQQISSQNTELEMAVQQLEKLNKSKDYFFSILAHDLKNPVAALKELSGYLYGHMPEMEPGTLRQYLRNMHHSSTHVFELLVNLLSWSMSQSRKMQPNPEACDMAAIIQNNAALLEPHLHNKNIALINEVGSCWIYADPQMMDVVIRNLLSNSIKFTDYGGYVKIAAQSCNGKVLLTINDNGIGMSGKTLEHLFDIDKQTVNCGTAGEKGTGLGLVIVRDFLQANNAAISVSSQPGRGSTFTIELPAAEAPETTAPAPAQDNVAVQHTPWQQLPTEKFLQLKGRKILLVEDNREMRDYLRLLLSEIFEIFEAENGSSGYTIAREVMPSVIIADLLMPGMNGLEFCRQIKSDTATSHIPVVILTSQDASTMQASGYEAGAEAYLTKPVDPGLLAQVLLNLLHRQDTTYQRLRDQLFSDMPLTTEMQHIAEADKEFLQQLIRYIETHMGNQDLDAQSIAKALYVSRTLLYNKLKALTGQTVHEFIKIIRLRKSVQLLIDSNMSINQIAFEVGFNSHSYFDKCFIKQYGAGPREYIARKRAGMK